MSIALRLKQRQEELDFIVSLYRTTSDEHEHARIRIENFLRVQVINLKRALDDETKKADPV